MDGPERTPWRLEQYRPYLKVLARRSMGRGSRQRFDSSDVVQDALVRAHQGLNQFRGATEAEFRGWLARILKNSLVNTIEAFGAQKRAAALEQSFDAAVDDTSNRLEEWLAGDLPSPSDQAIGPNEY